jgi:hypothetical protein
MASSGEGSFSQLSPIWRSTGGSFAPTATTWNASTPTTTGFPSLMVVPRPENNHPSLQHHTHHDGPLVQAHGRHPLAKLGSTPR